MPENPLQVRESVRPSCGAIVGRALRLKCPRCGEGALFCGWIKMPTDCSHCQFRFERGPGYFLGSSYINYGFTALSITFLFLIGRFQLGFTAAQITPPLAVYALLLPLLMFRYARAGWLALDCCFDSSVLIDEDTTNRG